MGNVGIGFKERHWSDGRRGWGAQDSTGLRGPVWTRWADVVVILSTLTFDICRITQQMAWLSVRKDWR